MAEKPCALLKDLRSTGYFFDELKNYSESPEMDIATYCSDFAIPYLLRTSQSYDKSGQPDRGRILRLAIEHLSKPGDEEVVDSIFQLKKVALSEMDEAGKAAFQEQLDKSQSLANRQKLESAKFITKLLVNIIRLFRLAERNVKQKKSDGAVDPLAINAENGAHLVAVAN
jgi:hypothetical protein